LKTSKQSIDQQALKILSSTYWSPSGWKKSYSTPPEDFAYAKASGFMFDSTVLSHDEKIAWVLRSHSRVSKTSVANGFLASLTSRRLDWRSALGTYAVALHFPEHRWNKTVDAGLMCPICGDLDTDIAKDLSRLSFERFKWGGISHTDPAYIGFGLEQFSGETPAEPTKADRETMKQILEISRSLPGRAKLSHLAKALTEIVPSNSCERRILIGILGFCGILRDPSKPGFIDGFPRYFQRPEVPSYENQWPYPVEWWNGSHGVSEDAVNFWFPNL
jgi:hypothetical protein